MCIRDRTKVQESSVLYHFNNISVTVKTWRQHYGMCTARILRRTVVFQRLKIYLSFCKKNILFSYYRVSSSNIPVLTKSAEVMSTSSGWIGVEQSASWLRSQLILLRLHSHTSVRRLVGITLRRQARVRYRHLNHCHCHNTDSRSCTCSRRSARRTACHHGTCLCMYCILASVLAF